MRIRVTELPPPPIACNLSRAAVISKTRISQKIVIVRRHDCVTHCAGELAIGGDIQIPNGAARPQTAIPFWRPVECKWLAVRCANGAIEKTFFAIDFEVDRTYELGRVSRVSDKDTMRFRQWAISEMNVSPRTIYVFRSCMCNTLPAEKDLRYTKSTEQIPTVRPVEVMPRVSAVSPKHSPK